MKTLIEAAVEFEQSFATESLGSGGSPMLLVFSRTAFMAGAAAMAEQFAQGQGTVLQLIRDLAEIQTRNAQMLAERIRDLGQIQAQAAGLTGWQED